MTVEERLQYEARVRLRQTAVVAAAAVLLIVGAIIQLAGPHTSTNELTVGLIYANKRQVYDVVAAVVNAMSTVALAATLVYLWGATRARNAGFHPYTRVIVLVGGTLAVISSVANAVLLADKAHQFVTSGSQTYPEANHLTTATILVVFQYGNLIGTLMLAAALVLISLNSMRVGLLTRFMGYLGIFAGILMIFPLVQVPVVEAYWLLAMAVLLAGRWPSGNPPAWTTGQAEPWPSAAATREARVRAAGGGRGGRVNRAPEPVPEPVGAGTATRTRATTPKRKRKRRK